MKRILSIIITIIVLQYTYSQDSLAYNNKGFNISYKIKQIDKTHSVVTLFIKNVSDEDRYVSISKKDESISSEKIAFLDIGNRSITDPLLNPEMLFHFTKLKKNQTYQTTQRIYNNNAEQLNVSFEYFTDLEKMKKVLKKNDEGKLIYALKCKDYVYSTYTKGEIYEVAQKFIL